MLKFIIFVVALQTTYGSIIKRSTDTFVLQNATQTESPWLALIKIKSKNIICGGSLVNSKFIVTAAHCFDDVNLQNSKNLKKEMKIILGEWKTETDPDCEDVDDSCDSVAEITAKKVFVHEKYRTSDRRHRHEYDIAVIQLAWSPRQSELIENIDLTDRECSYNYTADELYMTGFGHTPQSGNAYSKVKKSITMDMQTDQFCAENQKDTFIRGKHMCGIGTRGETTCSGDSGSGLTSERKGINMLEGIVSYGVATCREANKPSGFVKIACLKDWIDEKIN